MSHKDSHRKAKSKDTKTIEPKSSVGRIEKKLQSTLPATTGSIRVKELPTFKDTKSHQHEGLFISKLQQCRILYNFLDPASDKQGKEMKSETLTELCEYISSEKAVMTPAIYIEVARMIAANIFRAFPCEEADVEALLEGDNKFEEASWNHLKLVYQFFLKFVDRKDFDQALATDAFNDEFLIHLLETFNSGDSRERAYLKTILHRLYGKLFSKRAFIRQQMNNIFLRFIYEVEQMNGISELLEIFGSIINGFVLPLKPEHITFLHKVLIPLHKTSQLCLYHNQLTYCITQFIDKDPSLTEQIILGLLKFWPVTSSSKQVLFLNELDEIIDGIDATQLERIQEPLFKKLAECVSNEHFLVSQRALFLWNNTDFVNLIEGQSDVVMPIIFPDLYRISKTHWNSTIVDLVEQVLESFHDMNPDLYESLKEQFESHAN